MQENKEEKQDFRSNLKVIKKDIDIEDLMKKKEVVDWSKDAIKKEKTDKPPEPAEKKPAAPKEEKKEEAAPEPAAEEEAGEEEEGEEEEGEEEEEEEWTRWPDAIGIDLENSNFIFPALFQIWRQIQKFFYSNSGLFRLFCIAFLFVYKNYMALKVEINNVGI